MIFLLLSACGLLHTKDTGEPVEAPPDSPAESGGQESADPLASLDPSVLPAGANPCREPVYAYVSEVVDGDTMWVHIGSTSEKVRFIGVDTPEIAHDTDPADCYGDEAREFTRAALEGGHVWLSFDSECLDYYDRTLAYVSIGEGESGFFERVLLEAGYAEELGIEPNTTYEDTFKSDEATARAESVGMWGACR